MPIPPLAGPGLRHWFRGPNLCAFDSPSTLVLSMRALLGINIPCRTSKTSLRSWEVPRALQRSTLHTATGSSNSTAHTKHLQSFITPDGIFSPTRVLHSTTNRVTYLQSTLAYLLPCDLLDSFLSCLDDVLIYACAADEILKYIRRLF